jgi:hypothetical protein
MNEESTCCDQNSVKKLKTSVLFSPDHFVVDRIKTLKKTFGGVKREDNKWTKMLKETGQGYKTSSYMTGHLRPIINGSPQHPLVPEKDRPKGGF